MLDVIADMENISDPSCDTQCSDRLEELHLPQQINVVDPANAYGGDFYFDTNAQFSDYSIGAFSQSFTEAVNMDILQ